tara:strand:- start:212 stop:418 length:207 start_codon:yes stop_codon:yes gene_type:complete
MQVANNVNARRIIDGVARLTQQDRQWQTSDNVVAARHERDLQRYNEQRERERLRDRLQSIVDAFIVNN